jgi:hypothetical protein
MAYSRRAWSLLGLQSAVPAHAGARPLSPEGLLLY